ncbi:hypothetical protein FSZ31_10835 [Sphingorhabdus soli]|uniref:Uncharacterized protein n=1 Tax=Flavisphingopyxis soli TaxID=2601267 RepID=A0A5C6U989_9SPHN|nr:hypothetical protein [Sphingorhabdus soli]TXC68185.1 hypothetical protein FSZ31_10835 [Sphingorhabdus soli]
MTLRQAQGERKNELDEAKLARRAQAAGDAAARRAIDRIAAAIGADYPALTIEREIAALRVSGAALRGLARRDVRLRLPELWLDGEGGAR